MDSTTECEDCSVGEYAGLGSSACTSCASTGQFDDDRDPSKADFDTDICLQVCAAGYQDDDCDELTCVECAEGSYAVGGVFPESRCVACAAGLSDDDMTQAHHVFECSPGLYAEADLSVCIGCPAGRFS